jgi:hypothetical protein
MARKRYKLTGFARFFIVMLFLAPIAYFTAIYINEGEDAVRSIFEGNSDNEKTEVVTTNTSSKSKNDLAEENRMLMDSINVLNRKYHELRLEYKQLEDKLGN